MDWMPLTWQQQRFWHWNRGELFWDVSSDGAVKIPITVTLPESQSERWALDVADALRQLTPIRTYIDPLGAPRQSPSHKSTPRSGDLVLFGDDPDVVTQELFETPMGLANPAMLVGATRIGNGRISELHLVICHSATDGFALGLLTDLIRTHKFGRRIDEPLTLPSVLSRQQSDAGRATSARSMRHNRRVVARLPSRPFRDFAPLAGLKDHIYTRLEYSVPGLASAAARIANAASVSPASVLVASLALAFTEATDSEAFFSKVTFSNRSGSLANFFGCAYHEGLMLVDVDRTARAEDFVTTTFRAWISAMANARYSATELVQILDARRERDGESLRLRTGINLFWNGIPPSSLRVPVGDPSCRVSTRDWPDDSVDLELKIFQFDSRIDFDITMHNSLHGNDSLVKAVRHAVALIQTFEESAVELSVDSWSASASDRAKGVIDDYE